MATGASLATDVGRFGVGRQRDQPIGRTPEGRYRQQPREDQQSNGPRFQGKRHGSIGKALEYRMGDPPIDFDRPVYCNRLSATAGFPLLPPDRPIAREEQTIANEQPLPLAKLANPVNLERLGWAYCQGQGAADGKPTKGGSKADNGMP